MAEETKKEGTEHINLKVLGQDGQVVHFKIKQHTSLKKLMSAYCARSKLAQSTVRFRFDGQPVSDNDTPRGLDMEDGDTIEVFQQQTGGRTLLHSLCGNENYSNPAQQQCLLLGEKKQLNDASSTVVDNSNSRSKASELLHNCCSSLHLQLNGSYSQCSSTVTNHQNINDRLQNDTVITCTPFLYSHTKNYSKYTNCIVQNNDDSGAGPSVCCLKPLVS